MTRGRRLLLAVLQRTTAAEIAARCGVAPSNVSRWVGGLSTPADVPRARLAGIYGIPCGAWERPAVNIAAVRHASPQMHVARAANGGGAVSARGHYSGRNGGTVGPEHVPSGATACRHI